MGYFILPLRIALTKLYFDIASCFSYSKDAKKIDKSVKSSVKQQRYQPPGKSSPSKPACLDEISVLSSIRVFWNLDFIFPYFSRSC